MRGRHALYRFAVAGLALAVLFPASLPHLHVSDGLQPCASHAFEVAAGGAAGCSIDGPQITRTDAEDAPRGSEPGVQNGTVCLACLGAELRVAISAGTPTRIDPSTPRSDRVLERNATVLPAPRTATHGPRAPPLA